MVLTEITLHYVCKTHRAGGVDLVKRCVPVAKIKANVITCKAAARLTLSAFGLISSIEEDMMEGAIEGKLGESSPKLIW